MKLKNIHGQSTLATKNPQRAAWGRKGGESRSTFKIAASRTTIKEARNHLLSRRTCHRCHQHKLGWGNKSGVCRACQRNPAATLPRAGARSPARRAPESMPETRQ